jgi:hypothetical protein
MDVLYLWTFCRKDVLSRTKRHVEGRHVEGRFVDGRFEEGRFVEGRFVLAPSIAYM